MAWQTKFFLLANLVCLTLAASGEQGQVPQLPPPQQNPGVEKLPPAPQQQQQEQPPAQQQQQQQQQQPAPVQQPEQQTPAAQPQDQQPPALPNNEARSAGNPQKAPPPKVRTKSKTRTSPPLPEHTTSPWNPHGNLTVAQILKKMKKADKKKTKIVRKKKKKTNKNFARNEVNSTKTPSQVEQEKANTTASQKQEFTYKDLEDLGKEFQSQNSEHSLDASVKTQRSTDACRKPKRKRKEQYHNRIPNEILEGRVSPVIFG